MAPTVHEIDPNGDTLFILRNANAPFAISEKERDDSDADLSSDSADKSQIADDKPEVRMRLSSKHLILASAYFQKLAANGWKETTPQDGYTYVVTTEEWDEEALVALMNIIHGRTAKVPRVVSLEMLAKISVLVDYYQCHETVEFFAKTWTGGLGASVPVFYGRDLLLRFTVAWVFSEGTIFWLLTKTIILESKEPIDSLGLPIPQDIINALNTKREDLISGILSGLHDLKTQLSEGEESCSFECSSIYLGALIKGMKKMRVLDPRPERPFLNHSLLALEQAIRNIKEPSWYNNCPRNFAAPAVSGGLFGNISAANPPAASSRLFGSPPRASNPTAATTTTTTTTTTTGGLFGNRAPVSTAPTSTNPTPTGRLFASKTSAPGGLFSGLSATPAKPCSIAAKTKPIIDGQLLTKMTGLHLEYFVNKE
ncbi:hypothetical protein V8C37DRAFT_375434 [Trichoderma ceciliae]